jgi:hypothetical protein
MNIKDVKNHVLGLDLLNTRRNINFLQNNPRRVQKLIEFDVII